MLNRVLYFYCFLCQSCFRFVYLGNKTALKLESMEFEADPEATMEGIGIFNEWMKDFMRITDWPLSTVFILR